jgi:hypothetical protein
MWQFLGADPALTLTAFTHNSNPQKSHSALLVVRLDFEEVEGLFLAEGSSGVGWVGPIGHGQRGSGGFGTENFPMVGDAKGDFRLRI